LVTLNVKGLIAVQVVRDKNCLVDALGASFAGYALGLIRINPSVLNLLTGEEIDFVLSHELFHILDNHLITRGKMEISKAMLNEISKADEDANAIKAILELINIASVVVSKLSFVPSITKVQEISTDVWAIRFTGNYNAAVSALTKLVKHDLDHPSHLWELYGVKLPVMSMNERLKEVQTVILNLNQQELDYSLK
jgi:Zn-dependent protease with chaperone function